MNIKKNKATKALCAALAVTALTGVSAYFTDRVQATANVKAGTVGIHETENWGSQLEQADGINNINPGDMRDISFNIANDGNKAVDVRTTLKLSVQDANGLDAKAMAERADQMNGATMLQFDIYRRSDVESTTNSGYKIKDNAVPVFSTKTAKGDTAEDSVAAAITKGQYTADTAMGCYRDISKANEGIVSYYFAGTILNGVGDDAETGYANNDTTGKLGAEDAKLNAEGTAIDYGYVLVFRDNSLNDMQGCKLTLDMIVEAKQHLNTSSSWAVVDQTKTELHTVNTAGDEIQSTVHSVVNKEDQGVLSDYNDKEGTSAGAQVADDQPTTQYNGKTAEADSVNKGANTPRA